MRKTSAVFLLATLSLWIAAQEASGRLLENWSYERLFKEADLVVIARAESVEDTEDRTRDNPWKVEFLGRNTTFTVYSTLKGKLEGKNIKVLHYKLKEGTLIENGPCLVSFRTKDDQVVFKGEINQKQIKIALGVPEYLLFLKARKDGRYEPLSGQTDPALSIREMSKPLEGDLRKDKD